MSRPASATPTRRCLAAILDDGAVAEAFWEESGRRDCSVADLRRFADEVVAQLDGPVAVGLAWLRARCLDLSGETEAAIELLETAVGTRLRAPAGARGSGGLRR